MSNVPPGFPQEFQDAHERRAGAEKAIRECGVEAAVVSLSQGLSYYGDSLQELRERMERLEESVFPRETVGFKRSGETDTSGPERAEPDEEGGDTRNGPEAT